MVMHPSRLRLMFIAMIFSDDAPKLEAALHRAFDDKRMNKANQRKEYFM